MGTKNTYDELHSENFLIDDDETGWEDSPPTAQQLDEMAQWYEENAIDAEIDAEYFDEDLPSDYFSIF